MELQKAQSLGIDRETTKSESNKDYKDTGNSMGASEEVVSK